MLIASVQRARKPEEPSDGARRRIAGGQKIGTTFNASSRETRAGWRCVAHDYHEECDTTDLRTVADAILGKV